MVKTYKEYMEGVNAPSNIKNKVNKIEEIEKKSKTLFTLIYPENTIHYAYTGDYPIGINGKVEIVKVSNGLVKTENEELSNALEEKGFFLLKKEGINE